MPDTDEEIIIKLNQQGPPGPKGADGIDGFSPEIGVETSTANTYRLSITNRDNTIITPNLMGPSGPQGEPGRGIVSYTKTGTSGLVDTYTIAFSDDTTQTLTVTNGRSITSITGPVSVGLIDTYTINYNDNTTSTFTITNGQDGQDGEAATISVGTTTTGNPGTNASVVNSGTSGAAILDFTIPRGDKGDMGSTGATGNGIVGIEKTSTSGLVDTYTITYTNGDTDTFTVTNGQDGTVAWGGITGTLSNQTDLQNALNGKQDILTAGTDLEIVQGSIVPSGYTQVEYLQSDGACYIDLLRVPNNDDIIEQKFQTLSTGSGTFAWYGSVSSSSQITPRIGMGIFSSGAVRKFFLGTNATADAATANTDVNTIRFQATGEKEITYIYNGETSTYTATTNINTLDPAVTLTSYLFARHGENGVQSYDGSGTRIFYHKEYLTNGTLALDVVPARRNSDNALGMYDLVSGNFLTNQGTGTFTAGADVLEGLVINFTNNSGYTTNVGTVTSVNNVSPVDGNVTISVPTDTADLTNGAGYITSSALSGYATETWVGNQGYITGITSTDVTTALGYTPVNPSSLATVATTGAYSDLSGTPTIPTVNNATLTITQGGVSKGTFTANASSDVTIALDAGSGSSTDVQINGTSITSSDVANIITETAYNASTNKIATMSDITSYHDNTKQDVLTAIDPIEIVSTTIGGNHNLNLSYTNYTARYPYNLSSASTTGGVTISNASLSNSPSTINEVFGGNCSYFDIPTDFGAKVTEDTATVTDSIIIGGMTTFSSYVYPVAVWGYIEGSEFVPVLAQKAFGNQANWYTAFIDGGVSNSSSNSVKLSSTLMSTSVSTSHYTTSKEYLLYCQYNKTNGTMYSEVDQRNISYTNYCSYSATVADNPTLFENFKKINVCRVFVYVNGGSTSDYPLWANIKYNRNGVATSFDITNNVAVTTNEIKFNGSTRNIGEVVTSTIPLTDAGLHLLDGSLIQNGSYADFVDYIGNLYTNSTNKYSNVLKYGSLTDTDGVLSNFNSSNYALLNRVFNPGSYSWEMCFKVTTGAIDNRTQIIMQENQASGYLNFALLIRSDSKWGICVSSNGTGWNVVDTGGSYTVQANTTYWVRFKFTGTQYILEYSLNGTSWTTDITANSSTAMFATTTYQTIGINDNKVYAERWGGSIDLNESYININGSRWWDGRMASGFCTEEEWQNSITNYGVCGLFVYDSTNETVRLPKITGIIEGTTDLTALGQLTQAGLPNITGTVSSDYSGNFSGAFYYVGNFTGNAGSGNDQIAGFDASRSNAIYGRSNTVQPQTIKVLYYIVIATTTKTDIQVDIDEIATDLNGKCDTDLSNCTRPYIIETYSNGTSGYNLYSNNYLEQWGETNKNTGTSATSDVETTLLKQYGNTNYIVTLTDASPNTIAPLAVNARRLDAFGMKSYGNASTKQLWKVCGYITTT